MDFIACLEQALCKTAGKHLLPLQAGGVPATCASTQALQEWIGFVPSTPFADGVGRFVAWYRDYHPD